MGRNINNFVFIINVYDETEWTLKCLNELEGYYPESKKVVIFDGTSLPEVEQLCNELDIRVVHGDHLFIDHKIEWIKRWMYEGLREVDDENDWIVRFEPEIETRGRLSVIPNCDVFGCISSNKAGCKVWHLQGPAVFIRRRCIRSILDNGLLNNPIYNTMVSYRFNSISDTHVLSHVIRSSKFIVVDHPELFFDINTPLGFYPNPYKMIHPRWWNEHIKPPMTQRVYEIGLSKEFSDVISQKLKDIGYTPLNYPYDYTTISDVSDSFTGLSMAGNYKYLDKTNKEVCFILGCSYDVDEFVSYCKEYLATQTDQWKIDFFLQNLINTIGTTDIDDHEKVKSGMVKYYDSVKQYFENSQNTLICIDNLDTDISLNL